MLADLVVMRRAWWWVALVAVAVPTVLFGWRALHAPVNFDGGMNLQVASSLAQGEGYIRPYDGLRVYPHEVQTNGPFIFTAALAIRAVGENQLGYQLANLVFIAGFSAVVFLLLRDRPVARVVGPTLVLLGVPSIAVYALGGLGEIPTAFFLFGAVLALTEAVRSPERAPLWVFGGCVAFGGAVATKTFATGATLAIAAGLLCVLAAAGDRRTRLQVLLATGGAAVVPVVREVHRLASLGSLGSYRSWWSTERTMTAAEAGDNAGDDRGLVATTVDHVQALSQQVGFPAGLLAVALFLPAAWVAGRVAWRWRAQGWRETASDPALALLVMLAVLATSYMVWWLGFLPEDRLWIRRMIPCLLALHLLYLLLVPWLARGVTAVRGTRAVVATSAAGILAVALCAVPYGLAQLRDNTESLVRGERSWLSANRAAASYIAAHQDQRYFGDDWWSAPVVSLMAGTDFGDLVRVNPCSLDPERDRVVWDYDAATTHAGAPASHDGEVVFEPVASFGGYLTIFSVRPAPGRCTS